MKPNNDDPNSDIEVSFPGLERENSYIYMNKTSMNRMLLREASKKSKRLKYEFLGYTVNGQVQVKKHIYTY